MPADTETAVADHYTTGALYDRVRAALRDSGVDPDNATSSDLFAGDQFHTGGLGATEHMVQRLEVTKDMCVLDVGCGIGGTSRYIAHTTGAHVIGVDLTPEFIDTAKALGEMVGLTGLTDYHVGSALEMPVPDDAFDLAVMMHVGMNIADKAGLFAEVARVLKPGGTFAMFEVMRGGNIDALVFPLPWSTTPDTSFVAPPELYRAVADAAGFTFREELDRTAFAKEFFEAMKRQNDEHGPNPYGIHLMMGDTAPEKLGNYVQNLHAGRVQPTEMIFDLPGRAHA